MSDRSITDIDIPGVIDTNSTDFIDEFYNPLLTRASEYKRGVGYFSGSWVQSASRGLATLAEQGGSAKWITSPILDSTDREAIKKGNKARCDEVIRESLLEDISSLETALDNQTQNAISWLIADGVIEIRFAVPTNGLAGQFHDKWGILRDADGNRVAFHGSQNDSYNAQLNYESYDIFCDWKHETDLTRVNKHEERFDRLWNNEVDSVTIHTIGETIRRELIQLRTTDERPYTPPDDESLSHNITLRPYQQDAVDAWFENNHCGLFQMATGTGKTYTALGAMDELNQITDSPLFVVVSVPMTHLASQWAESLKEFDYTSPHFIYGSANPSWKKSLDRIVSDFNLGLSDTEIVITTHTSGSKEEFRDTITRVDGEILLIGDEVHNMGSEHRKKGLLPAYDYRIGLSATPERFYDEEGSEYLLRYFEGTIYKFTIGDAIPEYLSRYNYYPRVVEMEPAELSEYRTYTHKIVSAKNNPQSDEETLSRLLQNRARIIKSAEAKFAELRDIIQESDVDHMLIYTNYEQINRTQKIMTDEGVIHRRFTAEESDDERQEILSAFASGTFEALVAMKCLDEGVDVPSTKKAILMSNSKNPMEFVQRRGRVLRRHGDDKEPAEIYDIIVVPTLNPDAELLESEQSIVEKELDRFNRFVKNANNTTSAELSIQRIRTAYQV